jgi:hypothetical protein
VRNDEAPHVGGEDPAHEIAELLAALERHRVELQEERRRARKWEREAVLRASTVAGSLAARVLAAQRLASVVERNMAKLSAGGSTAAQEVREALEFFREVTDAQRGVERGDH